MLVKLGADGRLGIMRVGMFTSMLLVFLGAVADGIYVIILRAAVPVPSVEDGLNFLGYASAAMSGLQFVWYFRAAFGEWRYKLPLFLGVLVAGPDFILSHPSMATHMPLAVDATWLAYPILDGVLVVLAIMMLLLFNNGILSSAWRWLAVGLILITIADVIVGVGNVQGWVEFVQPFYLFYLWGYICLGLGFSLMPELERLHPLERDYHTAKFMRSVD
jgi:hypothetical protein